MDSCCESGYVFSNIIKISLSDWLIDANGYTKIVFFR